MIDMDVATTCLSAAFTSRLPLASPGEIYRFAKTLGNTRGANPASLLRIAAARWPDRTAIVDDHGSLTYIQLLNRAQAVAANLRQEHGIHDGAAVAVMCRNGRGFIQAVFGAAMAGSDVVLLNTDFTAPTLAATLSSHAIGAVLADDEFAEILAVADSRVVVVNPEQGARQSNTFQPSQREISLVLLTSGTTGTPKGVPRKPSPSQVLGVTASILQRTKLRTGDRAVVAVPFFHAFGLGSLFLAVTLGATIITRRRFDAETTLALASIHRARAMMVVPVMLARILDLPENVQDRNPLSCLSIILSGGAPLEPALATRALSTYGPVLFNGYGSSEVGIGAIATPADLQRAPGTVGRPVAGSPMQVLDDDDNPLGPNTVGRIFVGGRLAFEGYSNGATKPVVANLTATGDMGFIDNHGCLHVVGRDDDMILSGGENVYPQGVENALASHPDVLDNAVIGVPDREFGQRLAAFVVARPEKELTENSLRDYLKGAVSRFEQPRDFWFMDEIPRNPTGKALKKELAERYK